jgi:hypothetical protein
MTLKCGTRGFVNYLCFVVICFLVVDRKIIAFKLYRPFVVIIWGESINLDFFVSSDKS